MAYFDNLIDPDSPEVLSEEEFAKVLKDNDYYDHYNTCMKEYIDDFRTPREERLAILVEVPGKDLYFSVVVEFLLVSWETVLVYVLTRDQYIDTMFVNYIGAEALDKTINLINGRESHGMAEESPEIIPSPSILKHIKTILRYLGLDVS